MALTDDDLQKIKVIVDTSVQQKIDVALQKALLPLSTGEEIDQKLDEKIRLLPTREEFFDRMDKLSGEYKKIDEAETLHAGKLAEHSDTLENHDDRIKILERRHVSAPTPPIMPHS